MLTRGFQFRIDESFLVSLLKPLPVLLLLLQFFSCDFNSFSRFLDFPLRSFHFQDTGNDRVNREPSVELQQRPRNRWGDDIKSDSSRERDGRSRNRWGDDIKRRSSYEPEDRPRNRCDDERRTRRDYSRDRRSSVSSRDEDYNDRRDNARDNRRDSGHNSWYPGKVQRQKTS
jgi:hypothetical protein